jgi:broad specificity phosphatase PhoE
MATVTLVRHAQASFFGANYDQLSALGLRQATLLGEHWADTNLQVDRVYVGPLRRHHQTVERVAQAFKARGLRFPDAEEMPSLTEHDGLKIMQHALSGHPNVPGTPPPGSDPSALTAIKRTFVEHYLTVMRDWAMGQLVVPGTESWSDFRHRSLDALDRLCQGSGRVIAFTSGGLVSSAVGWLLALDDTRVIELSTVLRNTALSELHYSARRRMLVSFNTLPHITDPESTTTV